MELTPIRAADDPPLHAELEPYLAALGHALSGAEEAQVVLGRAR
jgi:hypothetical protein